jgi:hypothetical protein
MRSAQELENELIRTRRRLYRLTGWMTLAFIACLAIVFAAVGGALVVVDQRATHMLGPDAGSTREAANAPAAPAKATPIRVAGSVVATQAGAAAKATVAAAAPNPPARPTAPPPETTGSASAQMPPPEAPLAPPATGAVAMKPAPAQAADTTPPPQAKPPRATDTRRSAHSRTGTEPRDTARRPDDARERDARERTVRRGDMRTAANRDEEDATPDDGGARRVIVLGPSRYVRPADDRDDAGAPPRQRGFFHDLFGIFGSRGDQ